jgi:N-acyl-D-amino-acid deacylase
MRNSSDGLHRILKFIRVALLIVGSGCGGEQYDLLIQGGRLVDGSGQPAIDEDLAIRGDRIVARGRLTGASADRIIDAQGLIVAPGFIDLLGHSSLSLLVEPNAESKIRQGITTEITGEGRSPAPQNEFTRRELEGFANRFGIDVDWDDFDGYFARLERQKIALNLGSYVGATQVRKIVLGSAERRPTSAELARMQRLVRESMQQGALGLSSALAYAPASYAKTDELVSLARVAGEHGGIYATHLRSEGAAIFDALEEALTVAREAEIAVEIFHLKVAGPEMRGRMGEVLAVIEAAQAEGLDVTANQYPYVAGQTALAACLPPWMHAGGSTAFLERLRDRNLRDRLFRELSAPPDGWENFCWLAGGGEGVWIAEVGRPSLKKYEGMQLSEVARMSNVEPVDALLDLLLADNGNTSAFYFLTTDEDVTMALAKPWVGFGTDASVYSVDGKLVMQKPHPRAFGTFPRVLGHYVRERGVLGLEAAIRKMTALAAERVGLRHRGQLVPGFFADFVVLDPEQVRDVASFENGGRYSIGTEYVAVNGELVLDRGHMTGALPGRVLRGPEWRARSEPLDLMQVADLTCRNEELDLSSAVVVVPHPDDEIVAFGGLIRSITTAGQQVRIVIVTDGQTSCETCSLWKNGRPPQAGEMGCTAREFSIFGHVRRREALAALTLLGVDSRDVTFLGYVDGSLAGAWNDFDSPPARPRCASRAPLPDALRDKTGAQLFDELLEILRNEPDTSAIFTTHALDSHPDHSALYQFVRAAVEREGASRGIFTAVIHDNSDRPCAYPNPAKSTCEGPTLEELIATPGLIADRRAERYGPETWLLPPVDVDYGTPISFCLAAELYSGNAPLKRRAIELHATQIGLRDRRGDDLPPEYRGWGDWSGFLLSFVHRNELFYRDDGRYRSAR